MRAAPVVLLASVSMACAGLHARTQPEGPPLDVPPPPSFASAPVEPEPDPPAVQPSPPRTDFGPARRLPHPITPKPAPARKIDKPDTTEPPPTAPAKPAAETAPPAASLQTTANVDELEKKIRAQLSRAIGELDKIKNDVGTFSPDKRAHYDEARRFAEQAEAALKVKNLTFAEQLAQKAATLADLLAKR